MSAPYDPKTLGTPVGYGPRTFVQTERKAHESWAALTMKSPRAAALMHHLVANMGHQNAVVITQSTLAKLMKCCTRTIISAVRDLEEDNWIQVLRLNATGKVNAYVVNSNVAWGESRDQIGRLAIFSANVVVSSDDQPEGYLERSDLRKLPIIYPPEEALPHGEGEPGAQTILPGMEPVIVGNR